MKAETVFIPTRALRGGPPPPFAKWSEPGAILAYLRARGFDVMEVVNWIHARVDPGLEPPLTSPWARERGFWIYYYGAQASARSLRGIQ